MTACGAPKSEIAITALRRRPRRTGAPKCRAARDRKSTRLNSSHLVISYAVFCLKKKKTKKQSRHQHFNYKRNSIRPYARDTYPTNLYIHTFVINELQPCDSTPRPHTCRLCHLHL